MIVFDAGVLIAHLDDNDPFRSSATAFMEEYEEFEFAAGVTTIAEAIVHPASVGSADVALDALDALTVIPLDLTAADTAGLAHVRAATRLRMPDAIVLYVAQRHAAELVTTDRALARAAQSLGVIAHLLTPTAG